MAGRAAHTLNVCVEEMICSANMSSGMYPASPAEALPRHRHARLGTAQDTLSAAYRRRAPGRERWCLTEPQCGTDSPHPHARRTGRERRLQDHRHQDLHLGRGTISPTTSSISFSRGLPDAPAGSAHQPLPGAEVPGRGVGALGARNGVRCGSIRAHKMGIKASATCVINFGRGEAISSASPMPA